MKTLSTSWGQMAYADNGTAEFALLLLHGTGCDSADWEFTIRELPRDVRVVTLDFRGHGQSDVPTEAFELSDLADDVLLLVEHFQLRGVVLVGHSLGGMVAMEVARRSVPVAGLVLLEGWTRMSAALPVV